MATKATFTLNTAAGFPAAYTTPLILRAKVAGAAGNDFAFEIRDTTPDSLGYVSWDGQLLSVPVNIVANPSSPTMSFISESIADFLASLPDCPIEIMQPGVGIDAYGTGESDGEATASDSNWAITAGGLSDEFIGRNIVLTVGGITGNVRSPGSVPQGGTQHLYTTPGAWGGGNPEEWEWTVPSPLVDATVVLSGADDDTATAQGSDSGYTVNTNSTNSAWNGTTIQIHVVPCLPNMAVATDSNHVTASDFYTTDIDLGNYIKNSSPGEAELYSQSWSAMESVLEALFTEINITTFPAEPVGFDLTLAGGEYVPASTFSIPPTNFSGGRDDLRQNLNPVFTLGFGLGLD